MRFRFVWVGKTRDENWLALQAEYLRRLSHFVKCEITEVRDGGGAEIEGKRIMENLNQSQFSCLLDVAGDAISSRELARTIEKWQNRAFKEIAFVVGGAEGVSRAVVERADFSLSLSSFTFTHEAARVLLLEQLYRSYTIIKGFPYQK